MLYIIKGRIASGKTSTVIQKIGERIKKRQKSILIVPDPVTYNFEHRLCTELDRTGFIDVEVCSFNRFASSVCDFCGKNKKVFLDDPSKAMVMRLCVLRAKERLTALKNASTRKGFAERCMNMISTLENCNYSYDTIVSTANELSESILKQKLLDTAEIYKEYTDMLAAGYTDNADRLECAKQLLKDYTPLKECAVYIDGFDVFTSRLYDFIGEMIKHTDVTVALASAENAPDSEAYEIQEKTYNDLVKCANGNFQIITNEKIRSQKSNEILFLEDSFYAFPLPKYDNECFDIRISSYKTCIEEVTAVAEDIARGVRAGKRYKDYAVLCNDTETYTPVVRSVFSRYEIPVYADVKYDTFSHSIAMYVFSLLKCVSSSGDASGGFTAGNLAELALSSFSPLDDDETDRFVSYLHDFGISYGLDEPLKSKRGDDGSQADFEILRQKLTEPLKEFKANMLACKNAREMSECCYKFFSSQGIYEKTDALIEIYEKEKLYALSDVTAQLWNTTVKLMNDITEFLGDRTLTVGEYAEILREGFNAAPTSTIPSVLDCVTFGDLSAAREEKIKITFIIGANDGVIPSTKTDERLVTAQESDILLEHGMELAHTPNTEDARMRFAIYSAICSPSEKLYISYPAYSMNAKADGDLSPSPIIERMKKLFPNLDVQGVGFDPLKRALDDPISQKQSMLAVAADRFVSDKSRELYKFLNQKYGFSLEGIDAKEKRITPKLAAALFTPDKAASISELKKFGKCPFAHFIEYGLKPDDAEEYTATAIDVGNLFHAILEEYVCKAPDGISQQESKKLAQEIFDRKLPEIHFGAMEATSRQRVFNKLLKGLAVRCAWKITESLSEFKPIGEEISFGYGKKPPLVIKTEYGTLSFKGRIDRADKMEKDGKVYLRVIDYKTNKEKFATNLKAVDHLQLFMYMNVLLARFGNNAVPDSVYYMHITDDEKELFSGCEASKLLGTDGNGLLSQAQTAVNEIASGILSGDIKATPGKKACKYCTYASVCGKAQDPDTLSEEE